MRKTAFDRAPMMSLSATTKKSSRVIRNKRRQQRVKRRMRTKVEHAPQLIKDLLELQPEL